MKSVIFGSLVALILTGCTFTAPPVGDNPETVSPGRDLIIVEPVAEVPLDFGEEGVDYWIAKVRYGNSKSEPGVFEIEVGNGGLEGGAQRSTEGLIWENGAVNEFSLVVDSDGMATLTVTSPSDTATASYQVGGAAGDVYLYTNVPRAGSVAVPRLTVNGVAELGSPITIDGAAGRQSALLRLGLGEYDLSGGATITGEFIWTWDEQASKLKQEDPTIVLKIPRPGI